MNDEQRDRATHPEVGKRLGLSAPMVSLIRNGKRYPSLNTMKRVAHVYGWPVEEQSKLLTSRGEPRSLAYSQELERRIARKG